MSYKPGDRWVIVMTKSSAEEQAERSLRQAGYRVYLPRYRKMLRGHRVAGWRATAALSMRPAFQGYLFVQDWSGWPLIPINGIVGLMMDGSNTPQTMTTADIDKIRVKEWEGSFDEMPPPAHRKARRDDLKVGAEVEFAFHGERIIGVLDGLSNNGKAIIRAMMFNREVRQQVPADEVAVVAG